MLLEQLAYGDPMLTARKLPGDAGEHLMPVLWVNGHRNRHVADSA
jgi:hypothetical protein